MRFENDAGGIKAGFMGLDIGPKTQALYAGVLRKAKTIVWNGPMGVFEWNAFAVGTKTVAKAIVEATGRGRHQHRRRRRQRRGRRAVRPRRQVQPRLHRRRASLEMLEGKKFESVAVLDEA